MDSRLNTVRQLLSVGNHSDASQLLVSLSQRIHDDPLLAARCQIHAALIMIDSGDSTYAAQAVQTGIQRSVSPECLRLREPCLRPAEWMVLGAVSAAQGDIESALVWSRRAVSSVQLEDRRKRADGSQLLNDPLVFGDAFAVYGAAMLLRGQLFDARQSLENAFQLHSEAGDTETGASDLIWMAHAELAMNQPNQAGESILLARELLDDLANNGFAGRVSHLLRQCQRLFPDVSPNKLKCDWN